MARFDTFSSTVNAVTLTMLKKTPTSIFKGRNALSSALSTLLPAFPVHLLRKVSLLISMLPATGKSITIRTPNPKTQNVKKPKISRGITL